ncbi:MAG TPA: hypothetical protein EYO01_00225 [Phycisphaerales bacterium]|nr:hypothetical protein [Phycisphaerales bacterium]HIB00744.1 hypothetical protein [Phycisphaerales bacterium]HIB51457.1 hypothetical protein [Phycisphaerales bacterium]HIN83496.1 hypothetical protein [Phycisphaerales bacterium]HIO20728.1 hypothetical protein [Phycisphaerales bacterium]
MYDEGPSQEDVERFSEKETGYCPKCGDEIWDDVSKCPSCGVWIQGNTSHRDPDFSEIRKKMMVLIIAIIFVAFVLGAFRYF